MARKPKAEVEFTLRDRVTRRVKKVRDGLNKLSKSPLFAFASFAGAIAGFRALTAGNDRLIASQLKLKGIAKITGTALGDLETLSKKARVEFKLSTVQANEYASEMAKLAGKAGDLGLASESLEDFLEIGAARGLDAEQTLVAVKQAILGIDEGTDKLFDKNPSVLYKEYAAAIGTTAGKLTDQQKALAIVTAAQNDANKAVGSYAEFLTTPLGRQAEFNSLLEDTVAQIGGVAVALRTFLLPAFTGVLNIIRDVANEWQFLLNDIAFETEGAEAAIAQLTTVEAVERRLARTRSALASLTSQFAEEYARLIDLYGTEGFIGSDLLTNLDTQIKAESEINRLLRERQELLVVEAAARAAAKQERTRRSRAGCTSARDFIGERARRFRRELCGCGNLALRIVR